MKFVAVIGYGKSGKSTIISSLTGCRSSIFQDFIEDKSTGQSIFVCSGSPQERNIPPDDIKKWMKTCKSKKGCNSMVIAIQPTIPRQRVSMEKIFKEAMANGFQVYAFVVEPGYGAPNVGCYEDVVARLGSIGISSYNVYWLDGRKLALKSANFINSVVSII